MGVTFANGFRSLTSLRWVGLGLIAAAVLPGSPEGALTTVAVLASVAFALHAVPSRFRGGAVLDHAVFLVDAVVVLTCLFAPLHAGTSLAQARPASLLAAVAYLGILAGRIWGRTVDDEGARRESRELRAILEITEAVTGTLDLRRVMGLLVQRVGAFVDAERCSILLADEARGGCFVVAASDNPGADMLEVDLAKYPEIRQALRTGEPVYVEDVASDPIVEPVREILLGQGYRSLLVIPLVYGREVLGTLFLRASRGTPFTDEEIRFCRVAAGASANALKNALLYRDVGLEAARHRATGEKLRRVLDGTPDVIVATDPSGIITTFNRGAELLTGLQADEARGRPLQEVLRLPSNAAVPGDSRARPVTLARAGGGEVDLDVIASPLHDEEGGPAGFVWMGRDVTELRRVEKSLAQAERLSSLGEVVAGVAHELNNPLSAVLGYAQLVQPHLADSPHARDIGRIVDSAHRCQKIVHNLLSFARKHPPEKKLNDLNACVAKILDLKAYHLRASGVETVLELHDDLPKTMFDFHQIEQVVLNLVNNGEQAITAAGRGGRIVLRTRRIPGFVCLEIEDDGPGIPAPIRHRVFDPFFTTKEAGKGTGLGLSVSYGILEEHGGRIELRPSAPGGRTCFAVYLPLTAPDGDRSSPPAPETADPHAAKPLAGRRVLVAEDEPLVLDLFSRVLEADGATVTLTRDGEEAWERLAEADFDLVVADLRMPRLDGRALYERIVAERPEMVRRFVFATGDLVRQESLLFLEGLPNRILTKPLDVDIVRRVLGQALRK